MDTKDTSLDQKSLKFSMKLSKTSIYQIQLLKQMSIISYLTTIFITKETLLEKTLTMYQN